MFRLVATTLVVATISLFSPPLGAVELTFDQALALARERAPALAEARLRIDERRGLRVGADVLLGLNPVVDGAVGPRLAPDGTSTDVEIGAQQSFELGGRRGARLAAADASIQEATAEADDTARRLLRDVALAFLRSLHAGEQLRLARSAERLAAEIASVAERRLRAGDVPVLDVNLARATLARARSDIHLAEAAQTAALGELAALLGLPSVTVRGDLRARRAATLEELLARAAGRPDLRALAAGAREAGAQARLGEAQGWPDVGLGVRYAREEAADIVLGTLSFTLPLFEHGQGARAEGRARAARLSYAIEAGRARVVLEVRTAFDVQRQKWSAVDELEREALPLLDENETLARRGYQTGQIGLGELLLVRRETLEIRNHHLDLLLEAAAAGVELETSAGGLR